MEAVCCLGVEIAFKTFAMRRGRWGIVNLNVPVPGDNYVKSVAVKTTKADEMDCGLEIHRPLFSLSFTNIFEKLLR